jgi:hypothetical protein
MAARSFIFFALAGSIAAAPVGAQIRTVDPNAAMQSDLAPVPASEAGYGTSMSSDRASAPAPAQASRYSQAPAADDQRDPAQDYPADNGSSRDSSDNRRDRDTRDATSGVNGGRAAATSADATYHRDDLISAAEGVFGKGAQGLAKMIEKVLHDQGEPNGYIAGREAGGAFIVGLRYGSGMMHHKVEGNRPVYWTGPSAGFDFGGNGAKTFVLVYNLYDSQDLYKRFPSAEGNVYFVGGFTANYLRRGDVVLIPIHLGVGWRLGASVGYMKFTERSKVMPF